ncbi:hypothetical protein Mlute_01652 [Meiothermus luteus]|uniref:Uncharacterized protein n=1 Tax=Meiothermus luteus TaxID=2026184 RepID=A0A399ENP9_9DEIN|nr:hypothetical protein [Meiothermus luteus]RIH85143.1 hypothetical protein Mlute_01652 [Meiothermus luteus]RMH56284.1 MAG: hypothetical protein D6684_05800 [Deinococcota bacterium]
MKGFRELLEEAIATLEKGKLPLSQAFHEEARAQVSLEEAKGDRSPDPVARSLRLGREALLALAQGERAEAHGRLRQALRLHPGLGGGLGLELARLLAEDLDDAAAQREVRALMVSREQAWMEAPRELRLLRSLSHLPPGWWEALWKGNRGEERARATPRAAPPKTPPRPQLRFPVRFVSREKGPEEDTGARALMLMPARNLLEESWRKPSVPGEWRSPEGALRVTEEGRFTLRLDRLPEARGALLLLKGRRTVLLPVPWVGQRLEGWIPLPSEPEEDWQAEVWTAEELTPEHFQSLLSQSEYPGEILLWLMEGLYLGELSGPKWWQILRALLESTEEEP